MLIQYFKRTLIMLTAIALTASPSFAQDMSESDILKAYGDAFSGVMVNNPTNTEWKTISWNIRAKNVKGKIVNAPEISGQQAYHVKIKAPGKNHWDYAIRTPAISDIKAGDVIQIIMTARASSPDKISGTGIVEVRLQQKAAPFTGIVEDILSLSTDWRMYYINGTAAKDHAANDMDISFNIGSVKQTLEFGQFYIVNKGQGFDISKLPTQSTPIAP